MGHIVAYNACCETGTMSLNLLPRVSVLIPSVDRSRRAFQFAFVSPSNSLLSRGAVEAAKEEREGEARDGVRQHGDRRGKWSSGMCVLSIGRGKRERLVPASIHLIRDQVTR